MSKRYVDDQCVDVHASRLESVRLLDDSREEGDFVAIRLEARSHVQHWAKYHRLLSVESKGMAMVYLDAKDAAALMDRLTEALEEGENNEL